MYWLLGTCCLKQAQIMTEERKGKMYSPQLFPFLLKKLHNGIESVYKHERMMLRIGAKKVDLPRKGSRPMTYGKFYRVDALSTLKYYEVS